jgi:hypothetical protein
MLCPCNPSCAQHPKLCLTSQISTLALGTNPESPLHVRLPQYYGTLYQSEAPAYLTGPFSLGPRIFSRQCFDSISVRSDEVQKEMAKALCDKEAQSSRASDAERA